MARSYFRKEKEVINHDIRIALDYNPRQVSDIVFFVVDAEIESQTFVESYFTNTYLLQFENN